MISTSINVILCISVVACSAESQKGNPESKGFSASQLEWKHVFGVRDKGDKAVYTLMAQGFMGMAFLTEPKFCDDLDEQIGDWLRRHPEARVIPIQAIPFGEDASFTYVWITDGDDILNVQLVRGGCCVAKNMQVTPDLGDLLIPREDYDAFDRTLQEAENLAIKEQRGVWATERFTSESHWRQAERFEQQGKFTEAIAEFKAALGDVQEDANVWIRIGRCYEKLKQHKAALQAFDKAIRLAPGGFAGRNALIAKAEFIARREGTEKAAAVFGDVPKRCAENLEPCLDLGLVHMTGGHAAAAVEVLEQGVQAYITRQKIRFDDGHFVLDEPRVKNDGPYWLSVNHLAVTLPTLATYCLALEDYDKAFKYASTGLSAHQSIKTYLKDRYDAATIEAGDFHCRLTRGQVFMQRSSFEEAKHELDEAKILVDVGYIQGAHVKSMLDQAYAHLQTRVRERDESLRGGGADVPKEPKGDDDPAGEMD